ncbi:MAG: DRTGG domain-containing protein [Clostridiales bacterium]
MIIKDIQEILSAQIFCCEDQLNQEIHCACGSDMMSDVLAFAKDQGVLLTGLNNPQVVRTAEMMDMHCIIFVRGKAPNDEVLALAKERKIVILSTAETMFIACGKLYESGLKGGSK